MSNESRLARMTALAASTLAGGALLLSGCATGLSSDSYKGGPAATASVHINGNVHGGQNPVSGSLIQLYTVGTSGLKSASTPLIGATITSDQYGNFGITGQYSCTGTTPGTQVYITATGGDPGLSYGANPAIEMAALLGSCSSLNANTFVQINELTTIAAAYALQPFSADITHVGASGSNPTGLVNAFANAQALVNTADGHAGDTPLGAGASVPVSELNTLGNILAACVNSQGATSTACTQLFNATGATDMFSAALGIARAPGAAAVTALYTLPTGTAPFQPGLGAQPKDFSVAITSTGSGTLKAPYGIAIDAVGDAWVTSAAGSTLTALTPTGATLAYTSAVPFTGAQGIAIDRSGNVWIAGTATNSVIKATVAAGVVTGSTIYTAGGLSAPAAIAMDSAGNAWVANFNGGSVSGLTTNGVALSGSPFTGSGLITVPTAIAVNAAGNVLVNSGSGSVIKLSNAGAYVSTLTDNALQGSVGLAIDPSGDAIASGFTTGATSSGAVSMFTSAGAAGGISPVSLGSAATPAGVAADGISLWVANSVTNGGLLQLTYGSATVGGPASGYGSLNTPQGVAVDASGCVWTANSGSNTVTKFVGLAAPVATPIAVNVGP